MATINALLGQKGRMSQVFNDDGMAIPVTTLAVGPCIVTQVKTTNKDGYQAIQLGFGTTNKLNRAMYGHLKKSGASPRFLREIRLADDTKIDLKEGTVIKVTDVLAIGDKVAVTSISKGKGFAGVVKRWGFSGGPKTHGQGDRHRAPGSIGSQRVGRVFKGKKMAGRMGGERTTVKGLKVIAVDEATNTIKVKGSVPGNSGSLVIVKKQSL